MFPQDFYLILKKTYALDLTDGTTIVKEYTLQNHKQPHVQNDS